MMKSGSVLFVGAGPGDPKLLTIKGMEALKRADVVVYDRLANPLLLAHAKREARLIYCGKEADRHTLPQDEINLLLIREAKKGQTVVRLKGGDPSMFGRVGEEAQTCLEHGIPFEIVPGITSGMAAPLYAGIPLTHRDYNSSVAFVTGHLCEKNAGKEPDWAALATVETLVIYMGVKNLPRIRTQLLANGKAANTPVALVRWGTLGEQETLVGKLATIVEQVAEAGFAAPAIIVVGEVVQLRDSLNWYESKPLFGQTVAVASAQAGSSSLAAVLEGLGAEVLPIPLAARTFSREQEGKGIPQDLSSYQWLVFSCERQVSFFFQGLREQRIDVRELKGKVVAYGSAAAEALEMKGFYPDQVLDESTPVSSLHTALPLVEGDRILHVSSGSGSVVVHSNGAVTNTVQAGSFEWDRSHPAAAWLAERPYDFLAAEDVTVLSAFSAFAGSDWSTKPILCVGNETEKSAKMLGWSDVIGCAEGTDLIASVVDQTKTARAAIHLYS